MAVAGTKQTRGRGGADISGNAHDLLPAAIESPVRDEGDSAGHPPLRGHWSLRWATLRAEVARAFTDEEAYGHLFLWVPIFLGIGVILWFAAEREPSVPALAVLALAAAFGYRVAGPWRPALRKLLIIALLMCAGGILAALETHRQQTVIIDSAVTTTIQGIVTGREADATGGWRYEIRLLTTTDPVLKRPPVTIRLAARKSEPVDLGRHITGRVRLSPPSGPALPGLNDFAFDAFFSSTGAVGFFYGSPKVLASPAPEANWSFSHGLAGMRNAISARIRSVLPGDTGAFASSMVTDDRRAISEETTEALRLAGLAHIIAISGLNMALAAGIFFVGLRLAMALSREMVQRLPVKKVAAAGALVSVTGYYMISGFAVSAERAYIMMAIILVAAIFGKPSISLRNVALSAIVILVLSPSALLSPGFQMSFAATLALVAGYGAWQRRQGTYSVIAGLTSHPLIRPAWQFMRGVFLTSLIGGFSTALYSAEHFHRLAAWGLPANLLAMPIISFIVMPAGLLALALMPFGLDWGPLKVMGFGLDAVIGIAKWAASLGGDIVTGRIPVWFFLGMTAALLILALMRSRLRYVGAALALVLAVALGLTPAQSRPDIIIYEDGSLIGLVAGGTIATNRNRPSDFIYEQWRTALDIKSLIRPQQEEGQAKPQRGKRGRDELRELVEKMTLDLGSAPIGKFLCRKNLWCVARHRDMLIAAVEDAGLVGTACDNASIVITPARLRWHECRSGARLFDAAGLRRLGSVEISVSGETGSHGMHVSTSFPTLNRPWQRHRLYDWKSGEFIE